MPGTPYLPPPKFKFQFTGSASWEDLTPEEKHEEVKKLCSKVEDILSQQKKGGMNKEGTDKLATAEKADETKRKKTEGITQGLARSAAIPFKAPRKVLERRVVVESSEDEENDGE